MRKGKKEKKGRKETLLFLDLPTFYGGDKDKAKPKGKKEEKKKREGGKKSPSNLFNSFWFRAEFKFVEKKGKRTRKKKKGKRKKKTTEERGKALPLL